MKSRLTSEAAKKEMIPTESELSLRLAFQVTQTPYITDQIFCFMCGNNYEWHGDNLPSHCYLCGYKWHKGEFALPDLMFTWMVWSKLLNKLILRKSVIRVDGGIHTKSRKNINYDFFQVESFRRWGIRVFVVFNEEISLKHKEKDKQQNRELVERLTQLMTMPDEDYEIYFHSKESKERVRKI